MVWRGAGCPANFSPYNAHDSLLSCRSPLFTSPASRPGSTKLRHRLPARSLFFSYWNPPSDSLPFPLVLPVSKEFPGTLDGGRGFPFRAACPRAPSSPATSPLTEPYFLASLLDVRSLLLHRQGPRENSPSNGLKRRKPPPASETA